MAQQITILVPLARSRTGLAATLRAQLRDTAGVAVGGLVSTGFVEANTSGHYEWFYAAYPDSFEGRVDFTISGAPTVNVATAALNASNFGIAPVVDTAAISTAVWAYSTRTLTSFGTLVADVAAAVWSYATRTLTMSAAAIAAALTGTTISIRRGDTTTISITGLGNISTRTKLWFTVKASDSDADSEAILQIIEGVGLVYLNRTAATAAEGSLVVTNAVTGAVTITITAMATEDLALASGYYYDVQKAVGAVVTTLTEGTAKVVRDATRAIS